MGVKKWKPDQIYDIDSIVIYQLDKDEDACDVSSLYMAKLCQNANVILPISGQTQIFSKM